jgi:ubiquitin-like protein Pup
MPGQEQSRPQRREDAPDEASEPTPAAPEAGARKENLDSDIDSVLDEIDGVLESNAEEFVRGFVQKGGQ